MHRGHKMRFPAKHTSLDGFVFCWFSTTSHGICSGAGLILLVQLKMNKLLYCLNIDDIKGNLTNYCHWFVLHCHRRFGELIAVFCDCCLKRLTVHGCRILTRLVVLVFSINDIIVFALGVCVWQTSSTIRILQFVGGFSCVMCVSAVCVCPDFIIILFPHFFCLWFCVIECDFV